MQMRTGPVIHQRAIRMRNKRRITLSRQISTTTNRRRRRRERRGQDSRRRQAGQGLRKNRTRRRRSTSGRRHNNRAASPRATDVTTRHMSKLMRSRNFDTFARRNRRTRRDRQSRNFRHRIINAYNNFNVDRDDLNLLTGMAIPHFRTKLIRRPIAHPRRRTRNSRYTNTFRSLLGQTKTTRNRRRSRDRRTNTRRASRRARMGPLSRTLIVKLSRMNSSNYGRRRDFGALASGRRRHLTKKTNSRLNRAIFLVNNAAIGGTNILSRRNLRIISRLLNIFRKYTNIRKLTTRLRLMFRLQSTITTSNIRRILFRTRLLMVLMMHIIRRHNTLNAVALFMDFMYVIRGQNRFINRINP